MCHNVMTVLRPGLVLVMRYLNPHIFEHCMSPDPKDTSVDDEKESLVYEIDLKFKQSFYYILHSATNISTWALDPRDFSFCSFCVRVLFSFYYIFISRNIVIVVGILQNVTHIILNKLKSLTIFKQY